MASDSVRPTPAAGRAGQAAADAAIRSIDDLAARAQPGAVLAVSACLLGEACRYDGASKPSAAVRGLADLWQERGGRVVPVCPEQLGELGTPRPAADLRGGDGAAVLDGAARVKRVVDDVDVTEAFLRGARRSAERTRGAQLAILKARSPSCGTARTEIDGALAPGDGVFAALLRRAGVLLLSDEQVRAR